MDAFRICCFLVLHQICTIHGAITCKNQKGEPVDWFIIYKMPKISIAASPDIKQGVGFYYMDTASQKWTLGGNIKDTNQAVYYTLEQIYKNKQSQNVMYLMYNDEPTMEQDSSSKGYQSPEKQNSSFKGSQPPENLNASTKGHTKGDVVFDKTSGFWLVHSVPKFPPNSKYSYSYPESGTNNGQTFLCVTYGYKYLNTIGEQLEYNDPQIYDYNLPKSFAAGNKAIADVVSGRSFCGSPFYKIAQLKSEKGQTFRSFAKCEKFDADLYHDLVATNYKTDLYVQSWQNGKGTKIPSTCTSYKVQNVENMIFDGAARVYFKSTKDHSKWAVSQTQGLTCIGDINRMESQKKRGGGTVCLEVASVWNNFKSKITQYQKCP